MSVRSTLSTAAAGLLIAGTALLPATATAAPSQADYQGDATHASVVPSSASEQDQPITEARYSGQPCRRYIRICGL